MKKTLNNIVFWGAIWGLAEASLGYLLHMIEFVPGLSSVTMTCIGFFCMHQAYKGAEKSSHVVGVAGIAAGIKLVNFLMPVSTPLKVINPAVAILLEGALAFVALSIAQKDGAKFGLKEAVLFSFVWRFAFVGIQLAEMPIWAIKPLIYRGSSVALGFLLYQPLVVSLVVSGYMKLTENVKQSQLIRKISWNPAFGASALGLALVAQVIFH
ncbi:MAG: hypothetical protein N4A40_01785 [Tissierellales bacterium]|jgi:hypothetical protein|nr:hypothetical protein [Tissierellales bacterium]